MMQKEAQSPVRVSYERRNRDLDPQLVWRGKDEQNWSNRMILGDSLQVMASRAEREGLRGQVPCIYLDPPSGIKFNSNFQWSTTSRDVKDGNTDHITREPEQVKAFGDTWRDGIHSYLTYLRDRLTVARDLLADSGSIFVQIGDENVHRVRALMDEVFGEDNLISQIAFRTTTGRAGEFLSAASNYLLWFAKDNEKCKYRPAFQDEAAGSSTKQVYSLLRLADGRSTRITSQQRRDPSALPAQARQFRPDNLTSSRPAGDGDVQRFTFQGQEDSPGKGTFKSDESGLSRLSKATRLWPTSQRTIQYVRFLDDFAVIPFSNIWTDTGTGSFTDEKIYVVQTWVRAIPIICAPTHPRASAKRPRLRAPRRRASRRAALTQERTPSWQAWEIPHDRSAVMPATAGMPNSGHDRTPAAAGVTKAAAAGHAQGWPARLARHPEREASIAAKAEVDDRYDQPDADTRKVCVAAPFTVASLSPHRVRGVDEHDELIDGVAASTNGDGEERGFVQRLLAPRQTAEVQPAHKDDTLTCTARAPWPGELVCAEGRDLAGDAEFGTGSRPDLVAAARAAGDADFDGRSACAFNDDAHASAFDTLGRLPGLQARMNADRHLADDLKNTGKGHRCVMFGEPDLDLLPVAGGQIQVQLHGGDVWHPQPGEGRRDGAEGLAGWFIETDDNEERFFVRHADGLGANGPDKALKTTLKAEIDAEAWAALNRETSRPFDHPPSGRIAVQAITPLGATVMHGFRVR
jgi:adenine-specific DNA-methyltransferase